LLDRYDGKLQIVFKHLPLDTDCNESIKRNLHPHACEAACAAEAARRQGQFWEAHDRLFASSSSSRGPDIVAIAGQLELDTRIFEADRLSDATRRKIRADIEQGLRLGVDVTPAVFLNGRRVADIQPQALEIVIEHLTRQRQVPPNAARPMARN
jgi:protein-disulfide isomerase